MLHTWIYFCRSGGSTSHFHLWQTWEFQFPHHKFSNIPTSPAYGVLISQLIRYARACSSYGCFILRATRLSNKLLEQGYVKERLKSSLRKIYGRYGDLIKQYGVSLSQMLNDILWPDHIQWQPPTDQTLYRTRPFTEFWVVSIDHLRRVWHADRGRLLLRTPGPVTLELAYGLLFETNPFPNLSLFYRSMLFEYPSVHSRFCCLPLDLRFLECPAPLSCFDFIMYVCWHSHDRCFSKWQYLKSNLFGDVLCILSFCHLNLLDPWHVSPIYLHLGLVSRHYNLYGPSVYRFYIDPDSALGRGGFFIYCSLINLTLLIQM